MRTITKTYEIRPNANLEGASLLRANLRDTKLDRANLKEAEFKAPNGDIYLVGIGKISQYEDLCRSSKLSLFE